MVKAQEGEFQQGASIFSEIKSFFTSVRTTLFLLIILALVSIIGTIIPQTFQHVSNPFFLRLAVLLDLNNVFRSWWFTLILVFLSLNIMGCLIRRVAAIPREWRGSDKKKAFSYEITTSTPVDQLKSLTIQKLSSLLHASPQIAKADKTDSPKWKAKPDKAVSLKWMLHRYYLLGFPALHGAIIIILLGALLGLVYGYKGHLEIREGDTQSRFVTPNGTKKELPFAVKVEQFTVTHYPSGEPKEFRSDVKLLENQQEVLSGSIRVNHPLTYKGISLYQSDYKAVGVSGLNFTYFEGDTKREKKLKPGESFRLPGSDTLLEVVSLDPGTPRTGPGVEIRATEARKVPQLINLYSKDPDPVTVNNTRVRFEGYTPAYATGLQVGYDPGGPAVWTGCILLIIGFILILFTNFRQLQVDIEQTSKGSRIRIWGSSRRMRAEFRRSVESEILPIYKGARTEHHDEH